MSTNNNNPYKLWKNMGLLAVGTLVVYQIIKNRSYDRRQQKWIEDRNEQRERHVSNHGFQRIAEVESHSDGAANPSSEEVNDPSRRKS
ncbi:hypothetical protein V1514DRAFT_317405 [Lipomyces japonicus]|uniref:uncharacterized protein n=1 Tax=Lipomyces japonicus TaxID=56871 RepID=UPI0034CEA3E2